MRGLLAGAEMTRRLLHHQSTLECGWTTAHKAGNLEHRAHTACRQLTRLENSLYKLARLVAAYAFSPSIQKAETGHSLNLAWPIESSTRAAWDIV